MNPSMKLTLQESMKLLGEMTLLNRFLFSEVMSDPEVYTAALQIILGEDELKLLTGAQTEKEITPELKEFLRYIESPDSASVEKSGSDRLKKIHACVNRIKSSEEAGVKYMQKWLDQIDSFDEGMEKATLNSLRKLMQKQHMTAEEALDFLEIPKEEWENYIPKLQNQ